MRIKHACCKCYRILACIGIIFIVGKFAIWMLTANSNIDRKEPNKKEVKLSRKVGPPRTHGNVNRVSDDRVSLNVKIQDGAICEATRLPKRMLTKKDIWHPVDSKPSAYVLNAYLVETEHAIVVIGAKTNRLLSSSACLFWYYHSNNTVTVIQESADHMQIAEGRNLRYSAHMFKCNLKKHKIPSYISIVTSHCAKPLHLLQIQNASTPFQPERRFTVCLSPLHYNYSRAYELIEWIELNRILGAKKFIIYNHSLASNVASVLDLYSKRGITEVVQWRLPMGAQKITSDGFQEGGIYYFGQLAALNDCLYRQKHYSEFVVNLDVDEFIIPRMKGVNIWSDITKHLEKEAGAYLFRNVFFRTDWVNNDIMIDNQEKVNKFRLITLQKLEREKKVFPPRQRTKYFARTANTTSLMIHSVKSLPKDTRVVVVPADLALLHHYRNWQNANGVYKDGKIEDRAVPERYSHVLIKNVETIWSALPNSITLE